MLKRLMAVLMGTMAVVAPPAPTAARADLSAATLHTMTDTARWSGEFLAGAVVTWPAGSEVCAASAVCHRIKLTLDLPTGNWSAPGGLLVSIQWPYVDGGYDLDLYVYAPDGSLAAKSDALALSQSEGAWMKNPVNGTYTIVVMPKTVFGQPIIPGVVEPLRYDGIAQLQHGVTVSRDELNNGLPYSPTFVALDRASAEPVAELLPDLQPTTPDDFHIESTVGAHTYYYPDRGLRHQPSCHAVETLGLTNDTPTPGHGPLKCLRWTQGEYNLGAGPLELHNYPGKGDGTEVFQRFYSTDGSVRQAQINGVQKFSQMHGHVHYFGFQKVALHARNADGTTGPVVRAGVDKGICMVDVKNSWFGTSKGQPSSYKVPGSCDSASRQDVNDPTYPNESFFQMGLAPGYADIYPWFIADQYLDITGLADGRYIIDVEQNLSQGVIESDYSNNTASACVEIAGNSAAAC